MKRRTYRSRVRREHRLDVALGIVMLSLSTVFMAAWLLFAMALDCKHARFADAPYCQAIHLIRGR